jgi:hypothetical protein
MLQTRGSIRMFALLVSLLLSGGLAKAAVLYWDTVTLLTTDPTQLGRLSRDGVTADWSFEKPFPGAINPAISYHYQTIPVLVPNWLSYLQISIDSDNANIFASVYDTAYLPDPTAANRGLDINYLGDPGFSGSFFGNPLFFQVVDLTAASSPTGFGTILVVLNETTTNGLGLNSPVDVLVEGFSDTAFNEVQTTEPVPSALLGMGILAMIAAYRRRGWLK